MPLQITFATPLKTSSGVELASVYGIIEHPEFFNRRREVMCDVEFHVSEATYDAECRPLDLPNFPVRFGIRATAQEVDNSPILATLEQVLVQHLQRVLPADASIAVV